MALTTAIVREFVTGTECHSASLQTFIRIVLPLRADGLMTTIPSEIPANNRALRADIALYLPESVQVLTICNREGHFIAMCRIMNDIPFAAVFGVSTEMGKVRIVLPGPREADLHAAQAFARGLRDAGMYGTVAVAPRAAAVLVPYNQPSPYTYITDLSLFVPQEPEVIDLTGDSDDDDVDGDVDVDVAPAGLVPLAYVTHNYTADEAMSSDSDDDSTSTYSDTDTESSTEAD